jgi:hypothetical protein
LNVLLHDFDATTNEILDKVKAAKPEVLKSYRSLAGKIILPLEMTKGRKRN